MNSWADEARFYPFLFFFFNACNGIYKLIFGHSFSFDGGLWLTKSKSTAACPSIHIFDKEIWWCLNCTVFPWELGQFCLIWNNANFPESLDLQKKRPRKTCIIIKLFSWSYVFIWATKIHQNIFYLWTTSWRKLGKNTELSVYCLWKLLTYVIYNYLKIKGLIKRNFKDSAYFRRSHKD